MPLYEYRRPDGTTFDIIQKFSDDALTHDPDTGVPVRRVLSAPAIHFKGKGFHNTDYGTKKRPVGGGSEGGSGSDGGGSSEGSKSGDASSSSGGSSSEGSSSGSSSPATGGDGGSGGGAKPAAPAKSSSSSD